MTTPMFYRLGCELCNGNGCNYCDPHGNDRKAYQEYLRDKAQNPWKYKVEEDYYTVQRPYATP